jgi:hypothetical protein
MRCRRPNSRIEDKFGALSTARLDLFGARAHPDRRNPFVPILRNPTWQSLQMKFARPVAKTGANRSSKVKHETGGRGWDRTSDPYDVNVVLSR